MSSRRARGQFFTPSAIAAKLAGVALDGRPTPRNVCDPAAGDGRLLAAVADRVPGGLHLFGADIDHTAWRSGPLSGGSARFVVGDSLACGSALWPDAPTRGFDLVIGNPPFRGQLQAETWSSSAERDALQARFGDVASGYADTAAMFLVAACEMAAPTGRVALIMPQSFLSARDARAARRRVLELATLDGLWIAPEQVFPEASVQVCAVILDRSGPRRRRVRRWAGAGFDRLAPCVVDSDALAEMPTWSHLAAAAFGVPDVDLECSSRLGALVTTTAGFRDQFYGLAPLVVEAGAPDPDVAPLITSGLIDPGSVAWGERPARMAGTSWQRPAVDLTRLDGESSLGRWVAERLRPKIVVATQTKVIEAAPDPTGEWVPSTPVISVHVDGDDLWRVLAVLLAPPVTAWARTHYGGSALSADAVKLSARQVAEVPLPADVAAWDTASSLLRSAHEAGGISRAALLDAARVMTPAYGCDDSVTRWWQDRLPAIAADSLGG